MNVVKNMNLQTQPANVLRTMPVAKLKCRLCILLGKLLNSYMEYKAAELQRVYDHPKSKEKEAACL